jgi:hypothetical protein
MNSAHVVARIVELDPKFHITTWEAILMWGAFGLWLAYVPRLRGRRGRGVWTHLVPAARNSDGHIVGRELEVLLGTARPWLLVLGLLFPIGIQTLVGFRLTATWLMYLTMFAALCGGGTGRAAERSRAVWLRKPWTREELFARVEASFWKHNSYVLVALIVVLVSVAHYYALPARVVPLGIPLLVLAMVMSIYVGLAMTRGLHWPEATIAIVLMLALMITAVLAGTERVDARFVVGVLIVFAALAITLRAVARRRWHRLDWMLCRSGRPFALRSGT